MVPDREAETTLKRSIKVHPKAEKLIQSDDFLLQTFMRLMGRDNVRRLSIGA